MAMTHHAIPAFVAWCGVLTAQQLQPALVDLGRVAVGATVEASFGVFWTDAAMAKATAKVEAPACASVSAAETSSYSDRALTKVEFTLDTKAARTIDAAFTVRCGDEVATVALRAAVVAMPAGGSRVLIAETPFETFSSADASTFDAWRQLVAAARLDVDYRLVRRGRTTFDVTALSRVDIVLAGESALSSLDDLQVARLQGFVCGGGRLIVCANAFYGGTVRGANRVAEAFDLEIQDRESSTVGEWRAEGAGIPSHPLTIGVDTIEVLRPSPVAIGDDRHAVVLASFLSPVEQPFAAMTTTNSGGEMVVIGDSLWWNTASKSPGFARLLRNLLQRAPRLR